MSNVLNVTGLDQNKIAPVLSGLNELLASFQVYYANLRGYHWHVKGPQFYQLHKTYCYFITDFTCLLKDVTFKSDKHLIIFYNLWNDYLRVANE